LKPGRIIVLGGTSSVTSDVSDRLASYTLGGVTRISGWNRYATSAAISAASFASNAPVVYLASVENFPDALSAAAAGAV
jgi:putative cell wall-binding protein